MDRLARFAAAKNYALYYGSGREEELSLFDISVLEPAGQTEASVRRIKDENTLVLAYLSVMEVLPFAPEIRLLKASDFLSMNGNPLVNKEYGGYLADLRSNRWVGLLLHRAVSLINSGYDGLFLDTIGNIESCDFAADLRNSLLMAAVDILRQLRQLLPEYIIVQNCGLERLCLLTAGLINGICWENPPFVNEKSSAWVNAVLKQLEYLRERYGLKILLLLEAKDDAGCDKYFQLAEESATHRDFLLYRAPFLYMSGVNLPLVSARLK